MSFKKLLILILVITCAFAAVQYLRPVPETEPQVKDLATPPVQVVYLPWPGYGQSALGARDYGVLETHNQQAPVPIASIAKVITALAVLKQKPLSGSYQGPIITISPEDVATYNSYYVQGGSVTKVAVGEQINEYQALQALLLPSSNNMADTLARWAFASMDNYINFANSYVKQLGATQTKMADASGLSPGSVSTAEDLVRIGVVAIEDPTVSEIVKQQAADIPVAGSIQNVNWLLGTEGVVGIKTGNTDQAGGCFLFASERSIEGETVQVVGAVLGAPSLNTAIADSRKLIAASDGGFSKVTVTKKGDVLGNYQTDWDARAQAVAEGDATILAWRNLSINAKTDLQNIKPSAVGTEVGVTKISSAGKAIETKAVLDVDLKGPPPLWRLFH